MKLKVTALRVSKKHEKNPYSRHIYLLSGTCRVNGKLVRGAVTCKMEPEQKMVYDPAFMGYVPNRSKAGAHWRHRLNLDFPENMKPLERAHAARAIGTAINRKFNVTQMGEGA